ncbi:2',5'-phosphodiesterase 12-like [Varroa destructor]|uniref:Endonuclease/exonuclease/phosphatase domain-containing protein n=1 Tax=Varroa destructor TaxID=109461 RepID=A0A7M7K9V9_VARDE|nr:2',5'-phosphodiesterase 12-like [Varroa destructor]
MFTSDAKCALLFCGDFNSCPEFGVYRLFTTGEVPHSLADWKSSEEEAVSGLTASIHETLRSAYGTPDYTNYTVDFKGCLDYIFYSKELSVTCVIPLPPHEVVAHTEYLAIPSPLLPSDHLALVATLQFIEDAIHQ